MAQKFQGSLEVALVPEHLRKGALVTFTYRRQADGEDGMYVREGANHQEVCHLIGSAIVSGFRLTLSPAAAEALGICTTGGAELPVLSTLVGAVNAA